MRKEKIILFFVVIITIVSILFIKYYPKFKETKKMVYSVSNLDELKELFPKNIDQVLNSKQKCIEEINKNLKIILDIPNDERTFENTANALDHLAYYYKPVQAAFQAMELLSPDKNLREACQVASLELSNFLIDKLATNVELYQALKYYAENIAPKENLTDEQKYYLEETIKGYKQYGLDLPEKQLEMVRQLTKDITYLSTKFETNISEDNSCISVSLKELEGLSEEFINTQKKDSNANYIINCDYPTYFKVMDNCVVEETRKKLYLAFQNRSYPKNMEILDELIKKRAELAKLLGFESYAHFNLDNQMAKSPEAVHAFLDNLINKAIIKANKELSVIKSDLPDSVQLTKSGKIKLWDSRFIKNYYKKKYLNIDEQKISEYFPMEHAIKQLLSIYEQFFGICFEEVDVTGFWHDDVKLIKVFCGKDKLQGYILMDLYPRDNKYKHACHTTIVPCIKDSSGKFIPSVGIMVANFPKPTADKPSLLRFKDVETFFHEFGHAIHALFGCTKFYEFSGTNVKRDFVEMPSQMLENWLKIKDIMKIISRHYIAGESLPEDQIDKMIDFEKFDSGNYVLHQVYYSLLSLAYYENGAKVDTQKISEELHKKLLKHLEWEPKNHMQASFGHLTNYGPSYYGYLWSNVYAKDLFQEIKKLGLLNPEVGKKYANEILAKGGSIDPNDLLRNFLGREPNEKAFMEDLGLE